MGMGEKPVSLLPPLKPIHTDKKEKDPILEIIKCIETECFIFLLSSSKPSARANVYKGEIVHHNHAFC